MIDTSQLCQDIQRILLQVGGQLEEADLIDRLEALGWNRAALVDGALAEAGRQLLQAGHIYDAPGAAFSDEST